MTGEEVSSTGKRVAGIDCYNEPQGPRWRKSISPRGPVLAGREGGEDMWLFYIDGADHTTLTTGEGINGFEHTSVPL